MRGESDEFKKILEQWEQCQQHTTSSFSKYTFNPTVRFEWGMFALELFSFVPCDSNSYNM